MGIVLLIVPPPCIFVVQTVVFQVEEEDMDSFVMALGQKKTVLKMQKEYEDLVRMPSFGHHVF